MAWPCYWTEPSGLMALGLRRYAYAGPSGSSILDCAAGNHDAFAWRGITAPERLVTSPEGRAHHPVPLEVDHDDPAWPRACGRCGRPFAEADSWQEWEEAIYRDPAGTPLIWHVWADHPGAPEGMGMAGPGALRDGWWLPDSWRGGDGIALIARLPDPARPELARAHDWTVDGESSSGGRWARTGDPRDPPSLSVTPSIAAGTPGQDGYYHGHLTSGQLTDHLG